jgi:hypothetical protein
VVVRVSLRNILLSVGLAGILLASVPASAQTVPVPGFGPVGTPGFLDAPKACDPAGLVCVGPVHAPLPAGVSVESEGFVVVVDPDGTPGTVLGPYNENLTLGDLVVPVSVCPSGCSVPATPDGGADGGLTVEVTGPRTCIAVVSTAGSGVDCGGPIVPGLPCDPTDPESCGAPDPADSCLRDDEPVPYCFVPIVAGCDPLDAIGCAEDGVGTALDLVIGVAGLALDLAQSVLDLVPAPDELCQGEGTFPSCAVPCDPLDGAGGCGAPCDPMDVPAGCGPFLQAILGTVIPDCPTTPPVPGVNAYVCFGNGPTGFLTGPLGLRPLNIRLPAGGVTTI